MKRALADLLKIFIMLGLIVLAILMMPQDRKNQTIAVATSNLPDPSDHKAINARPLHQAVYTSNADNAAPDALLSDAVERR